MFQIPFIIDKRHQLNVDLRIIAHKIWGNKLAFRMIHYHVAFKKFYPTYNKNSIWGFGDPKNVKNLPVSKPHVNGEKRRVSQICKCTYLEKQGT